MWYAWSTIDYGAEHDDNDAKLIITRYEIAVGSKVSPSDLGYDGEDDPRWKELVDGGAIRDYELPKDLMDTNTSPQKIISARVQAMADGVDTGTLDATTVAALMGKKSYPLEGENEITPEGQVAPAQGTPPPATATN